MFQLDFNLSTDSERRDYISKFDLSNLSEKELELCANYILYGKDATGKSLVDKKYIYIEPKYSTYNSKRPESLDQLMENPNFEIPVNKIRYKTVKPTIDRSKDKDIPTIKEMWENIDELQHLLDANTGKIKDENAKKLTDTQIYRLKHILVDIRKGQYYLKDIFKPTIGRAQNKLTYIPYEDEEDTPWNDPHSDYAFAPLGLIDRTGYGFAAFYDYKDLDYVPNLYNEKAKYIVDFRKEEHIYRLLERYEDLECARRKGDTNLIENILETLNYYIARANLAPQHYVIIRMKIRKKPNKEIAQTVNELFGTRHTENYISTLWTKKICVEIANAAILHYDEFLARGDENAWKVCNTCGESKLKDPRLFVRKVTTRDGLSNRCKICDKALRLKGIRI